METLSIEKLVGLLCEIGRKHGPSAMWTPNNAEGFARALLARLEASAGAGPGGDAVAYIAQVEEENELLRRDRDAVEKLYYKANRDLLETIGVLRPFADLSELIQQDDPDDKRIMSLQRGRSDWVHVTVGDFRMAAAAQLPRSESDRDDKYYRSVAEANDPNFGIEEPGEVERARSDPEFWKGRFQVETAARIAAEAALAEARERLKKVEAASRPIIEGAILSVADEIDIPDTALGTISITMGDVRALRAALTGDAQEAGL